jgi:Fe-S cluster biogenesis protein NfuA
MTSPLVGLPLVSKGPGGTPLNDDAIYEMVSDVFREQINPQVAKHGGQVELIDVQDRTVVVRMKGGCQGCGMATVTLRQGIEANLRRMIPGLAGIRDITDHSAGTKPYYAPNG